MLLNSSASNDPITTSPLRHRAVRISPAPAPQTTARVMPIKSAIIRTFAEGEIAAEKHHQTTPGQHHRSGQKDGL